MLYIRKDMRICVLKSKEDVVLSWSHRIYGPEPFLNESGYFNVDAIEIDKATYEEQLEAIASGKKYDLLFNICDGSDINGRAGFEVCCYLNNKSVTPFVGPSVRNYNHSREEMKAACALAGIPTPKYTFVYDIEKDFSYAELLGLSDDREAF